MTDATAGSEERSGRIIGVEPKPRVLFSWKGSAGPRVAAALAHHAPTVRTIERLEGVRQDDYDVLVTDRMDDLIGQESYGRTITGPMGHLFVVSFAEPHSQATWGTADVLSAKREIGVDWKAGFLSKSVEVPDDRLESAADLVDDDLVPTIRSRESHLHFVSSSWRIAYTYMADDSAPRYERRPVDAFKPRPFLLTGGRDPQVLAGWYPRSPESEGWVVPSDVKRPWDWVAAAIKHWAITYRRFPLVGGWWDDPTWQTGPESTASSVRAAAKVELATTTARLEADLVAATAALEAAQLAAAGGLRRLLTEKGEPLKSAVMVALAKLGYMVIDRDLEEPLDPGGKIEDLGLVDPDDPTADPVVEVKGYDSGAKAADIGLIMRHLRRAEAAGRKPSATWWVINHWRNKAPGDRGPVLSGDNGMIGEHAADDVPLVVIDSMELFRAVRAVEDGQASPAAVRAALRAARGRWEWP